MSDNIQDFQKNGGQILSFLCDKSLYAFEITVVADIVEIPEITKVPGLPDYISGLINFRSRAVPVIDFRKRLGHKSGNYDERSCIIIIEINSLQAGIICDRVLNVETVKPESIVNSPAEGGLVKYFIYSGGSRISYIDHEKIISLKSRNASE